MGKRKKKKYIFHKETSEKLWIPSENSLIKTKLPRNLENTWFDSEIKENIHGNDKIKCKEFYPEKLDSIIRCKKVELYPTQEQKDILQKWITVYRYIYNQTVRFFRKNPTAKKSFYSTRKIIKDKLKKVKERVDFIKDSKIPSHTIDYAIKDVIDAYTSAFSNLKNDNIKHFKLRYKKKSSARQTLVIEASGFPLFHKRAKNKKKDENTWVLNNTFCPSVLGKHIKSSEDISKVDKNCRLTYFERLDAYYLFVPYDKKTEEYNQDDICVLDPGCRTFQTGYTSNKVLELGNGTTSRISYYLRKIDKSKDKKEYHRLQKKLKNKIDELHNKVANYLTKTFKYIIVGNLSTKETNKREGNLRKMTKRILSTLRHFEWRTKMKAKCEERGVFFEVIDEAYTSKTCSCCGYLKSNLGGNKIFRCDKCGIVLDRDYNGCRNILIKGREKVLQP